MIARSIVRANIRHGDMTHRTVAYDAALEPDSTVLSEPYLMAKLLEKIRDTLDG